MYTQQKINCRFDTRMVEDSNTRFSLKIKARFKYSIKSSERLKKSSQHLIQSSKHKNRTLTHVVCLIKHSSAPTMFPKTLRVERTQNNYLTAVPRSCFDRDYFWLSACNGKSWLKLCIAGIPMAKVVCFGLVREAFRMVWRRESLQLENSLVSRSQLSRLGWFRVIWARVRS